jgi:hypothetical protein
VFESVDCERSALQKFLALFGYSWRRTTNQCREIPDQHAALKYQRTYSPYFGTLSWVPAVNFVMRIDIIKLNYDAVGWKLETRSSRQQSVFLVLRYTSNSSFLSSVKYSRSKYFSRSFTWSPLFYFLVQTTDASRGTPQ